VSKISSFMAPQPAAAAIENEPAPRGAEQSGQSFERMLDDHGWQKTPMQAASNATTTQKSATAQNGPATAAGELQAGAPAVGVADSAAQPSTSAPEQPVRAGKKNGDLDPSVLLLALPVLVATATQPPLVAVSATLAQAAATPPQTGLAASEIAPKLVASAQTESPAAKSQKVVIQAGEPIASVPATHDFLALADAKASAQTTSAPSEKNSGRDATHGTASTSKILTPAQIAIRQAAAPVMSNSGTSAALHPSAMTPARNESPGGPQTTHVETREAGSQSARLSAATARHSADTSDEGGNRQSDSREPQTSFNIEFTAGDAPALTSADKLATPEARPHAAALIDQVVEAAEKMRSDGRVHAEMQVRLQDGQQVTVRLTMQRGEVHALFRTESQPLREALEQHWAAFSTRSADGAVRSITPVFESPGAQGDMLDLNQQRNRREQPMFLQNEFLETEWRPGAGRAIAPAASNTSAGSVAPAKTASSRTIYA
jgi:hypothetical protein